MNPAPKNTKIHIALIVLVGFVAIPIVIMLYASIFLGQFARNYHVFFASFVGITLPVVLVYVILQKYFINGLTAGATKS